MLSSHRHAAIHAGLSTVAQKVYAVVPMAESWNWAQIYAELQRNKISVNHNIMSGCLNTLVTQGLVAEPTQGSFRRIAVRPAPAKRAAPEPVAPPAPPKEEARMKSAPAAAAAPAAPVQPIDKLGILAARVAKIAEDLKELAADVGNAAVEAQMQMESSAEDTQKLRQLQAILKSVG